MYARTDKLIGMRKQNSSRMVEKAAVGMSLKKKISLVLEIFAIVSCISVVYVIAGTFRNLPVTHGLGSFATLEFQQLPEVS